MRDTPLADLDRPAVLTQSPVPSAGPERRFPTLREALQHAGGRPDGATPWIVTWSGAILNPREVADLRERARGPLRPRRWAGERRGRSCDGARAS